MKESRYARSSRSCVPTSAAVRAISASRTRGPEDAELQPRISSLDREDIARWHRVPFHESAGTLVGAVRLRREGSGLPRDPVADMELVLGSRGLLRREW